jgi:superfamily I DNA and/or RNA helicase
MSPDSVATLVPVGSIDFDVVVFDEASQVRTAHAVGALGRGKAGIVVGDSRQMPPSNVFSSNSGAFVEDDFDDEDEDQDELLDDVENLDEDSENSTVLRAVAMVDEESILKEFYAAQLPSMQLLCHYRSKDELLISFSNTHIYEEPMLTFPSTKGLEST